MCEHFSVLCSYHHYLVLESFITSKGNPIRSKHFPVQPHPSPPPGSHEPAFCLWIRLSWIHHANGITHLVLFGVWLLSLGVIFSSFIHTAACYQNFIPFYD